MSKFWVSKFYTFIFSACIPLFAIPLAAFAIYGIIEFNYIFVGAIILAMAIFLFLYLVYMLFFDFPTGTVEFDNKELRQRIGHKTVSFSWDNFCEYAIIRVPINQFGDSIYYVCCSTEHLFPRDKEHFMRKTRRKRDTVAYFQYNKKAFDELLKHIDKESANKLRKEESEIISQMRLFEKLYNR